VPARLSELADRVLEDVRSLLADDVHPLFDGLMGGGAGAAPGGHVEVAGPGSLHLVEVVEDPGVVVRRLE
jgi:hypothetical protein